MTYNLYRLCEGLSQVTKGWNTAKLTPTPLVSHGSIPSWISFPLWKHAFLVGVLERIIYVWVLGGCNREVPIESGTNVSALGTVVFPNT